MDSGCLPESGWEVAPLHYSLERFAPPNMLRRSGTKDFAAGRVFGACSPNREQVWRWGVLSERAGARQPMLEKQASSVRQPPPVRDGLGTTRPISPVWATRSLQGHKKSRQECPSFRERRKAKSRVQKAEPTNARGMGESQASHHRGTVVPPGGCRRLSEVRPPPTLARRGLRLRGEVRVRNRER